MSIQVYKKGNYIILIDSADSKYREDFAKNVKVSKSTLASTDYNIHHDGVLYKDVAFADLRDEANSAYADVATWETFYQDNTGGFDVATTGSVTAVANDLATHEGSDGSSHTFIDQDVTSGSSPTFTTTNFTDATDKRFMSDAQETNLDLDKGTQTTAQRNALVPSKGWRCYDTDVNKFFHYNGTVWIVQGELIQMRNVSGVALSEGHAVAVDVTEDNAVIKASNSSIATIGVVYEGGADDAQITVAVNGKWNVLMNDVGTVGRNESVEVSSTAGVSEGFGFGGTGAFATTTEEVVSNGSDVLVGCIIHPVERF